MSPVSEFRSLCVLPENASISSTTILPPGPLPETKARSTPFSFARRFAAGEAATRILFTLVSKIRWPDEAGGQVKTG